MKNDLLHLDKTFEPANREQIPFNIALYKSLLVTVQHLENLLDSLIETNQFWQSQTLLGDKCLVSVYCYGIVAKSNRIKELFNFKSTNINDLIVGARFGGEDNNHYHIFTYCLTKSYLASSIKKLTDAIQLFKSNFHDKVTKEVLTRFKNDKTSFINSQCLTKNQFIALIQEMSYINRFDTYFCTDEIKENSIVTLFDTNTDVIKLFREININITNNRISENNVLLLPDEFLRLKESAPYLICMAVSDFSLAELPDVVSEAEYRKGKIGLPSNEPTIGVIDTLFDENVYFNKWVEYHEEIDTKKISPSPEDYGHGTALSSLIVDLPNLNPELDDGCGHFRVRHFGVALKRGGMTSFSLMKKIEAIVSSNADIHVWNLSLGSSRPINENFISPEASILDQLQVKYPNIIFIVAGTNSEPGRATTKIGSPADSINSIVVNSVRKSDLKPASYSRSGPALSFFIKPDVSYFGGDYNEALNVSYPHKIVEAWGTSFAAPLIARKVCYMMDILNMSRESAKALLVDSAIGWERSFNLEDSNLIGRGIVPIDINDIVKAQADEIKFFIDGVSIKYLSYEYDLPVPFNKDKAFPYIARATLCYFPKCSRNQGVDYTDTELSLKFGRTRPKRKHPIEPINKDYQDTEGYFTPEKDARGQFRKWDNIKVLTDDNRKRKQPKKNFGRDNWGIEVTYSKRYTDGVGVKKPQSIKWGLVVTLKATDNKNRIEEFINSCILNQWRVYHVSIDNMIKVYNQSQLEVKFDE